MIRYSTPDRRGRSIGRRKCNDHVLSYGTHNGRTHADALHRVRLWSTEPLQLMSRSSWYLSVFVFIFQKMIILVACTAQSSILLYVVSIILHI